MAMYLAPSPFITPLLPFGAPPYYCLSVSESFRLVSHIRVESLSVTLPRPICTVANGGTSPFLTAEQRPPPIHAARLLCPVLCRRALWLRPRLGSLSTPRPPAVSTPQLPVHALATGCVHASAPCPCLGYWLCPCLGSLSTQGAQRHIGGRTRERGSFIKVRPARRFPTAQSGV